MGGKTLLIIILAIASIVAGRVLAPVQLPHIQVPAEPVAHLGSITITNTMVAGWLTSIVLLVLFALGTSSMKLVPQGVQNCVEYIVEFVLGLCENMAGVKKGRQFFPLIATIFFFVITANWMGLVPGFGTIGIWETPHASPAVTETAAQSHGEEAAKPAAEKPAADAHGAATDHPEEQAILVPLFRAASSDLNTTLAIALVSVIATQIAGIRALGGEYLERFFNLRQGPIGFYVSILELIAEFAKIISFTFRLFGNIFAGEVLLAVITFLVPWVAVLPFFGLELFVGFIQAFVFAALTLVFMTLATISHAHGDEDKAHGSGAAHH